MADKIEANFLIRSTNDFVVYLDKNDDIDWMTTVEYDKHGPKEQQKHHAILSNGAVLECSACHGLAVETKRHFRRLIGEAIAYSLDDDYENAQEMLQNARGYIRARSEETSRRWYLSASAIMAAIMIAFGLLIWIWRGPLAAALTVNFVWICLAAVAASCGALLSVIARRVNSNLILLRVNFCIILKVSSCYSRFVEWTDRAPRM